MIRTALRSLPLLFAAAALTQPVLGGQAPFQTQQQQVAPPQNDMTIAAVVNENIITLYDVKSRIQMIITTSGLENTSDMQQRLLPQVVDSLVEERLKLQEAARLKIKTSETEVRQAVDNIEARNNLRQGALRAMLASQGVDVGALYTQVEADVAWGKVVRQSMERAVTVADDEVRTVINRAKANQGKPEYWVFEISLPVATPAQEQAVHDVAERVVQQARAGSPFQAIAQQVSQSPTAALGGDLGWVVRGEMEPELDDAVTHMQPNTISDPIRTGTGYHIIQLREQRISGAVDPRMAVVTLSQVYLPSIGGRALPADKMAQYTQTIGGYTTCDQMNKMATELKTPGSGPIPAVYAGGLPEKVRSVVVDLKPGHTGVVEVGGARLMLQVCTRHDDTGLPSPEQIRSNLENEKLQNSARQKLRDLRRQALVDIHI